MREQIKDSARLVHILHAIQNVFNFMDGKNENDLKTNAMLFYAVVKNIEIIGEASYKLTETFKITHPDTPCRQIIKMRHILTHGYYQVSPDEIYGVYINDLPTLKAQITSYLQQ